MGLQSLRAVHVPSAANKVADYLSRPHEREGDLPKELTHAKGAKLSVPLCYVAFAHDRHRLPGLASLLPAQPTPLLWRPTPWSTPHTSLLAADAKEPDLGKKVPASNLGRKPDLSEKVTTSNLGRKPDLTEKVASTSEGVAIFTEDNRNGSRPSRFPHDERLLSTSSAPPQSTTNLERAMERASEQRLLEQEDGYPTFRSDLIEPYGNTAIFEAGGRNRNGSPSLTAFPPSTTQSGKQRTTAPSSPSATRRSTPQCKEKAKDAGDIILRGLCRGED
eukprot:s2757_g5.t1